MKTTSILSLRGFLGRHRGGVLAEAYRGILGREPDAEGLASHRATLAHARRLAPVLDSMVRSEEVWRRLLGLRAGALVGAVFRALLDREPEDEARAAYGDLLARTGDLEAFVAEVARSTEHENRVLAKHGAAPAAAVGVGGWTLHDHDALVHAVFRGLLGRDPDPQALATYTRLLAEGGDVAAFIAEVDRSAEHRRRILLHRP